MFFTLLSWCEPNSPIRYPIRRQVRDRPTVGKKVYIQSDRLLCALCSSWHCLSVLLYTTSSHVLPVPVVDRLGRSRSRETARLYAIFREIKRANGKVRVRTCPARRSKLFTLFLLASLWRLIFFINLLSRHNAAGCSAKLVRRTLASTGTFD